MLPNYQSLAYRRQAPLWSYLDDVFIGSEAWLDRQSDGTIRLNAKTHHYLPQEPRELDENYISRLTRSPFTDRFAQAIRDFVGMILSNGVKLVDVPPIIQSHWSNLDGAGTTGDFLLGQIAIAAMRRGHTFILPDVPPASMGMMSIAEAIARRPVWVHVPAPNVINWRNDGQRLIQATICQRMIVPDGDFGEREETVYLVLRPGRYDSYLIQKSNDGKDIALHLPDKSGIHGIIRSGRIEPLDFIPLVPVYGGDRVGFFESHPPLKALADLNIAHYQTHSDHRNKIHKCCFPVAVRFGVMGEQDELVLGPDTVIDAPPGGGFNWQEPNAGSLDKSRQEMLDIESTMDFLSAQYLIKPGDRQAAAVSMVQAAKVESSLYLFAQSLVQGINQALQVHARYLGLADGGRVELQTKFFQQSGTDSQLMLAYTNLWAQLQQMDEVRRRSLLRLLQRRGYLPDDMSLSEFDPSFNPSTTKELTHAT